MEDISWQIFLRTWKILVLLFKFFKQLKLMSANWQVFLEVAIWQVFWNFLLLFVATDVSGSVVGNNCTMGAKFKVNIETDEFCWMPSDFCLKEKKCLCEASPPESIYGKCAISWFCRPEKFTTTTPTSTTKGPAKSGLNVPEIVGLVVVVVIICLVLVFGSIYYYCVHVYIPSIVG